MAVFPRAAFLLLSAILSAPHLEGSELGNRLDALLAGVPAGGEAGVAVIAVADRRWLYQHQADAPRALASTTKLLVACAALLELGPRYEFHTRLVGLGPLGADGVLPGLGVIGGGSPCLDEHFSDRDPERFFRAWAAELKLKGVRRVVGDVVIDNHLFAGPIRPSTYPQDAENQQRWYSAPASAFAWNDNCIEVRVSPLAPGQPCLVQTRPRSARIQVRNQTRSDPAAGNGAVAIARDLKSNTVLVSGRCGKPTAWFPLSIQTDPDLLAGDHLKALLIENGIPVEGEVRLGTVDPAAPPLIDLAQSLLPAVTLMNQRSQNFYGEQLLRLVAVAGGQPGSIEAGRSAVLRALRTHLGDGFDQAKLMDGSGLSYDNSASAAYMACLLDAMQRTPFAQTLADSLKDRTYGPVRAHVKTGTLAVACCLVGYLDSPTGARTAFAVLLGKGKATSFAWAPKLRDRIMQTLADGVR